MVVKTNDATRGAASSQRTQPRGNVVEGIFCGETLHLSSAIACLKSCFDNDGEVIASRPRLRESSRTNTHQEKRPLVFSSLVFYSGWMSYFTMCTLKLLLPRKSE